LFNLCVRERGIWCSWRGTGSYVKFHAHMLLLPALL
jgi:hypothetical protein